MKKNIIRALIAAVVLLAVYHVLAFVIPFVHSGTFWLAYAFTLVGFGVGYASVWYSVAHGADAKNWFYGFPIAQAGAVYWLAQLVAGFLAMALAKWAPAWVAAIVFVLLLVVAVIRILSADAMRDEIQRQDDKLKADTSAMRALQAKVAGLSGACGSREIADAVQALADKLRFSDPVSSPALLEIETGLAALIDELQKAAVDGDAPAAIALTKKAELTLAERNRLCKLNKGK